MLKSRDDALVARAFLSARLVSVDIIMNTRDSCGCRAYPHSSPPATQYSMYTIFVLCPPSPNLAPKEEWHPNGLCRVDLPANWSPRPPLDSLPSSTIPPRSSLRTKPMLHRRYNHSLSISFALRLRSGSTVTGRFPEPGKSERTKPGVGVVGPRTFNTLERASPSPFPYNIGRTPSSPSPPPCA